MLLGLALLDIQFSAMHNDVTSDDLAHESSLCSKSSSDSTRDEPPLFAEETPFHSDRCEEDLKFANYLDAISISMKQAKESTLTGNQSTSHGD